MTSARLLAGSKNILSDYERAYNRSVVLTTYRHLLKATGIAFKGDNETLVASRKLAHDSFLKNRELEVGGVEASQGVEHAQGVAQILRENVVQGRHTGEAERYKLNIHEHTQKSDNGRTTELKGTRKSFKEIKDAQF